MLSPTYLLYALLYLQWRRLSRLATVYCPLRQRHLYAKLVLTTMFKLYEDMTYDKC